MKIRRGFQRALARLVDATGPGVPSFEEMGETLQPVALIADGTLLVPPRLQSWNGLKYSRTGAASNRAILAYVAPAGGAWIWNIAQAGSVDCIVRTWPPGDATLNAIIAQGTLEDEFNPWGPALRGRVVIGDSVITTWGDGLTIDAGGGLNPFIQPFPLEEGRVLSMSTPAFAQQLHVSIQIMEFPPEDVA